MTLLTVIGISACGHPDTELTIQQAESDLKDGNIELAANTCDMLTDTAATSLSSTQMCRIAIIYAKLSEMASDRHYMMSATECFDRAVTLDLNTDSLEAYINSLDIETQSVINAIRELSQAIKSPCDLSVDEYEAPDDVDPQYNSSCTI